MKKIITIIASLCMLFSLIPVTTMAEYTAEAQSAEYDKNVSFLKAIGAFSDLDYSENRILTRAEFAKLIVQLVGGEQYVQSDDASGNKIDLSFLQEKGWVYVAPSSSAQISSTAFSDVLSEDEDWKNIEFVTTAGFMVGDDTYFRPHDNVTGYEVLRAMSILLNLGCGKSMTTQEHAQKALSEGLIANISENDISRPLRMKDIAMILRNTLKSEPYITEFKGAYKKFYKEDDYLLMTQLYGVYEERGTVSANEYAALKSYKTTNPGYVVIGDAYYMINDFDIDELLGYTLDVYYNLDNDERNIIYYESRTDTNDFLVIESEDIISFENHTFKYYDKSRIRSVNVNSNMSVVYNGSSVNSYKDEMFTPKNGKIVFMKTGNSGNYNLAKITKYDTMVVKSVDYQKEFVLADVGDIKSFDSNNYTDVEFFLPDGTEVVFATISKDIVLSIASTISGQKERCKVIVCNDTASGKLESCNKTDETVTVNGTEYKYNTTLVDFDSIPLSTDITLYLDCRGVVTAYKGKADSGGEYGYLRNVIYDDNMDNVCYIKIYRADDTFITYTVSDKLRINGNGMKIEKTKQYLLDANGATNYQVIQFFTDDEGKLAEIVTADGKDGAFSKYDLAALGVTGGLTHRNKALLSYANNGFAAFLNAGGYVAFAIPADREDDSGYGVIKSFANETTYTFDELYLKSADSSFVDVCVQLDVVVKKEFDFVSSTDYTMISSIKLCVDDDDDMYYEINGYNLSSAVSYKCFDEDLFDTCEGLGNGDIVRFNLSSVDNSITWVEKFYDGYDKYMLKKDTNQSHPSKYKDILHPGELYSGWTTDATDSDQILLVHMFSYTDGRPDMSASEAAYTRNLARRFKYPTRIVTYDSETNSVTLGSKQDVVYSTDPNVGSTVVIGSYYENAQVMFVIK